MANLLGDDNGKLRGAATPTKAAAAADAVREAIQSGRLKQGERLLLPQLAAQLNMSYTPIREGLRELQSEGLVTYQPHLGTVVAAFDADRAADIYRLRQLLEPAATARAASEADEEQLAEIAFALKTLDSAVERGHLDEVPRLNAAFHKAIYQATGSPLMAEFIDRLWNGVPYQAISLIDRAHESSRDHAEILRALSARDASAAEDAMRAHISRGASRAMAALESDPGGNGFVDAASD